MKRTPSSTQRIRKAPLLETVRPAVEKQRVKAEVVVGEQEGERRGCPEQDEERAVARTVPASGGEGIGSRTVGQRWQQFFTLANARRMQC